jgi:hypothetical protein
MVVQGTVAMRSLDWRSSVKSYAWVAHSTSGGGALCKDAGSITMLDLLEHSHPQFVVKYGKKHTFYR